MSPSTQDKSRLPSEFEAIKSEHIESGMNSKSVQKMSEKPNLDTSAKHSKKAIVGKSDSRYWLQPGKLLSDPRWSGSYSCKIQVQSRRESFPLRTVNKNTAASKAARIYCDIVALGWEAAIAKHKPDSAKPDKGSTVGDLFAAVSELANVRPPTLRSYMATFRRIVADVMSIEAKAGR